MALTPSFRHTRRLASAAALLALCALALASCAISPEQQALATVGDREITEEQLRQYVESLPAAARQGLDTDKALLEAFILHRLLLLEAETVGIQKTPKFKEAFSGFGGRELVNAYIQIHVTADLDERQRASRLRALTDSLWTEHGGEVHGDAVELVADWLSRGRPQLETEVLDRQIGTYEAGQLSVGDFITTVAASDAEMRRRLTSRQTIASMVHGLIVNKIVDWEVRSLGLHEEAGYVAKVDGERNRLLVRNLLRKSASIGQDYEAFIAGLRQKYSVEILTPYPAE